MKFLTPCAAVLAALLLTGCGKAKPDAEARAKTADSPTPTSPATPGDQQPAAEDEGGTAQQDNEPDNGRAEVPPPPAAAEASATTWVCTWCHEEYTSERQPTSFQPDKCERNPGHAHAWHKQ